MDNAENRIIPFPGHLPPSDPETEAGRSETRLLLETAIDGLPADFRIVFVLREIEGCSVEETASQLGVKPQTIKTRHFRARQLLREGLEHKFVNGLGEVFPFLGSRCAAIADQVMECLNEHTK